MSHTLYQQNIKQYFFGIWSQLFSLLNFLLERRAAISCHRSTLSPVRPQTLSSLTVVTIVTHSSETKHSVVIIYSICFKYFYGSIIWRRRICQVFLLLLIVGPVLASQAEDAAGRGQRHWPHSLWGLPPLITALILSHSCQANCLQGELEGGRRLL